MVQTNSARVAIIIPILNEQKALPNLVEALLHSGANEVIFVDGGSVDGSLEWLEKKVSPLIKVIRSKAGRSIQMNNGAQSAHSDVLLFLHADTILPNRALDEVTKRPWGRFDIEFYDNHKPKRSMLSMVATMVNLRSRISGVATGDQAIFMNRTLFDEVGGFDPIPLMEDVAISKKLRKLAKPHCSKLKVGTSARRWKQYGIWKTIILMWVLRLAYFLGVSPVRLKEYYSQIR